MKRLYLFCLIVSIVSLHCGDKSNWHLGTPSHKGFSLFETFIQCYRFLFQKKFSHIHINVNVRNEPEKNSLTKTFKIDENEQIKNLLTEYLNYSCSNLSISKFSTETKQYEINNSTAGSRLIRNLSLFIHPDKIEEENQEKAKILFQILKAQDKLVTIPSESKSFYIRCFFELLNKHTDIKEFEQDLQHIHAISTEHRFALDNFSNLSISEIVQNKKALDELYKKSWKFAVNQIVEFAIGLGLLRHFCESLGSKLARNFIPHLKQSRDDEYYQQACKHYNIVAIKNPNKKAYILDKLKTEYNQYSPHDFLHKAIKAAGPYLSRDQLHKTLHYF